MDDPTRWCENDASNGTRLPGPPSQAGAPLFFRPLMLADISIQFAGHGDSRLRQHMLDLRFAQSGRIVFK